MVTVSKKKSVVYDQREDLERREQALEKLMKENEHDLNFMVTLLPKAIELARERKEKFGFSWKERIQYLKLKTLNTAFKRKIRSVQKSGKYSQTKV